MNQISENIIKLKDEFVQSYSGKSHVYEILPKFTSSFLPIPDKHLLLLHKFLKNNSIYNNSFDVKYCGIDCSVYEGDLNQFWIDSIKHDTSYAPFFPTWVLSAYALALKSNDIGFSELIDVGSGDGRIAYCGKIIGMKSFSIEIDQNLSNLQNKILKKTMIDFSIINSDALQIDFEKLNLNRPIFFIGGLPENGELLANGIIKKVLKLSRIKKSACFALTGTLAKRKFAKTESDYGWEKTIKEFNLTNTHTSILPTYWTVDQPFATPYIFTIQA